jgi:hypothetical protein
MNAKTIETLAWVLIYSGLLVAALGLFLRRSDMVLGSVIIAVGLLDTAAGVILVWLRSRMKNDPRRSSKET